MENVTLKINIFPRLLRPRFSPTPKFLMTQFFIYLISHIPGYRIPPPRLTSSLECTIVDVRTLAAQHQNQQTRMERLAPFPPFPLTFPPAKHLHHLKQWMKNYIQFHVDCVPWIFLAIRLAWNTEWVHYKLMSLVKWLMFEQRVMEPRECNT